MIIKKCTQFDFMHEFGSKGLESHFTPAGLSALFAHLDESSEISVLDVSVIVSQYKEYPDVESFNAQYGTDCKCLDDIRGEMQVLLEFGYETRFIIKE